jgi:hypothetical protein
MADANFIGNVSQAPNTPNPATDDASLPIYMQHAAAGYMAIMIALVNNAGAVQDYIANGLMPASETINNETEGYSTQWLAQLKQDVTQLNTDTQNGNTAAAQTDVTTFNLHNTEYNQATTFFGGITNGLNSLTSAETTQLTFVYQTTSTTTFQIQQIIVQIV